MDSLDRLDLPGLKTRAPEDFEVNGHNIRVYDASSIRTDEQKCPKCGAGEPWRLGKRGQKLNDVPFHKYQVIIDLKLQRYKCRTPKCITFLQSVKGLDPKRNMTTRCVEWIRKQALLQTFTGLAKQVGCNDKTIRNIALDIPEKELSLPKWLAIDEVHINDKAPKPKRIVYCVFSDHKRGKAIGMIEGVKQALVYTWLAQFQNSPDLQGVTMDMCTRYRDAVRDVFPNVLIVIDKFHVVSKANEALDNLRINLAKARDKKAKKEKAKAKKAEAKKAKAEKAKAKKAEAKKAKAEKTLTIRQQRKDTASLSLDFGFCLTPDEKAKEVKAKEVKAKDENKTTKGWKRDKYLLKMRAGKLSDGQRLLRDAWLRNEPELEKAYWLKEQFFKIYDSADREEATTALKDWSDAVERGVLGPYKELRTMMSLSHWGNEILAYFDTDPKARKTNALAESVNNHCKKINRMGYGYRFKALRTKFLFANLGRLGNARREIRHLTTRAGIDHLPMPEEVVIPETLPIKTARVLRVKIDHLPVPEEVVIPTTPNDIRMIHQELVFQEHRTCQSCRGIFKPNELDLHHVVLDNYDGYDVLCALCHKRTHLENSEQQVSCFNPRQGRGPNPNHHPAVPREMVIPAIPIIRMIHQELVFKQHCTCQSCWETFKPRELHLHRNTLDTFEDEPAGYDVLCALCHSRTHLGDSGQQVSCFNPNQGRGPKPALKAKTSE